MRFSIVFALIFCSQHIYSQSDIAIGEWSSFLPHRAANRVAQSAEKIIYATAGSIFTIDKDDMSIEYLSKVEGLTETGISEIVYDDFNDQLIVAYENSVFDIISGPEIMPVFDIKNNTNFIDRRINKLFVQNGQWLYFATGFGLLQYNLESQGFGFTLDAGQLISDISGNDEKLVMLGDNGVYVLDFKNEVFPNAFTSWKRVSIGLPLDYEAKAVLVRDNKVYIATDEYVYSSSDFEKFTEVYENNDPLFNALLLDDVEDGWIFGVKNTATSASKVLFFDMKILL